MIVLLILSMLLLISSLNSNSPLSSVMFLILSLVGVTPILSAVSHVWFVYLILMLFLGGIFILVLYFSSLCNYVYNEVNVGLFFIYLILFNPWVSYVISNYIGITVLFNYSIITIVATIILVLTSLILFSSYILSSSSALRNI